MVPIVYSYIAYNENKEIVRGKLAARNEDHATEILGYAGYQIVNLKKTTTAPSLDKYFQTLTKVKPTEVILFYRQMALLVESGLNIVKALELLEVQNTKPSFKKVLSEVISDVRAGSQLSTAMAKHHSTFPQIHCQSLKVGEQTGSLEVTLRQMADYMEKQVNSGKGVKNAMTLPIITLIVAVVVVAILVTFVLPTFSSLYESLGAKLPLITRLMLDMGNLLRSIGGYLLGGLALIGITAFAYIKTPQGGYQWDSLTLKFPVVGHINHLNELARVCRTISTLFKAGLSLTEIMPLVIQNSTNKVVIECLKSIRDDMLGGEGLSRPMSKHPIFLPMMIQMVRVGEETGNLDSTLQSVAQSYEAESEDRTKALIAMIQPVMTIFIGLVVGVMALSMMSAMYSIYGQGI